MRALILSAPIGAGHDTAARGVAAELEARGYHVEVDDGLALLGGRVEGFVVGGYRFQLDRAAWSWRALYWLARWSLVIRLVGAGLALVGGARLVGRIDASRATLVVSTYPLVSAALASLRRAGRLPVRCATIVTDVDPHPAWIHSTLDANLTVGEAGRGRVVVRPPVAAWQPSAGTRAVIRARFGVSPTAKVVLIVGGAWGVGDLEGAARASLDAGLEAVVVCGHNAPLAERLKTVAGLERALVVGYSRDLPGLMAAADVLIQNAGGLTCLEAFQAGLPVVMYRPLAGHGTANARRMRHLGLVSVAADGTELRTLLSTPGFWQTTGADQAACARNIYDRPSCGEVLDAIVLPLRATRPVRRRVSAAVAIAASFAAFGVVDAPAAIAVPLHGTAECVSAGR